MLPLAAIGRAAAGSGERGGEHQAADPSGGDDRQHDRKDLAAHDISPVAFANSVRICNITILVEIASAKASTSVAFFATRALTLWQGLPGLSYSPSACHDRSRGWNQPLFCRLNPVNFVNFHTVRTR